MTQTPKQNTSDFVQRLTVELRRRLLWQYDKRTELLLYLCDWKGAIEGRTCTDLIWMYNPQTNLPSCNFELFCQAIKRNILKPAVYSHQEAVLKHVVGNFATRSWGDTLNFVRCTHPMMKKESSHKFYHLDLLKLAREYKDAH